ncbi:MAG: flagellar motor protein MotA [Desulfobulbus propionicus]|nr:MAG: flagellar motor protein MotA [Desulfobulbus propionicus]
MKRLNLLGLLLCLAVFITGFILNGHVSLYLNISGLLIVVGGTLTAAIVSFRLHRLKIVVRVVRASFAHRRISETEIVDILINLAVKSRAEGILSLQDDENETSILFLRRGLGCLVDNYEPHQIRDILSTEMYFFTMRREDSERVLRTMADYLPAFGIIGSVVGLISMLGGIGDTSVILRTVPVALTSTLYGLILANFFFIPFASALRERTNHELLLQKIILEGIVAIASELNPTLLKTKLLSFLTPSARKGDLVPLAKIGARFNIPIHRPPTPPERTGSEFSREVHSQTAHYMA